LTTANVLRILATGTLSDVELILKPEADCKVFTVTVTGDDGTILPGIFKPCGARRYCAREVAAYAIDAALGWNLIPPVVMRESGDCGSVQLRIPTAPYAYSSAERERHALWFEHLLWFDTICNIKDRHQLDPGNIVRDAETGRLWAIDHSGGFKTSEHYRQIHHIHYRRFYRDVLDIDDPFPGPPPALLADMTRIAADTALRARLETLLTPDEVRNVFARLGMLTKQGWLPPWQVAA
jgi:hypothetical protein